MNFFQVADARRHGADRGHAPRRLQRVAERRTTASTRGARTIIDPQTGQPFPGNIIPANRLSPNGLAILNLYPLPTPGFRQGTQQPDPDQRQHAGSAQGQHPVRLPAEHHQPADLPLLAFVLHRAELRFGGDFPLARQIIDRPNFTSTASWTSTIKNNLINELTYTFSRDDVFIDVYTETGLYQRSRTGINYPYIFQEKEIDDKIPTVTGYAPFNGLDGGPYPASSAGPIHTVSNMTTLRPRPPHVQGRRLVEYSGEDDFDQINVSAIPGSTNNQNGRFEFLDGRAGGTGLAIANAALGLFSNYAELGQRNFTQWRSLATDLFVQDSWKPTSNLTIEGGVPLRLLAAVVLDDQQHRQLRSALLRRRQRRRSSTRRPVGSSAAALQRHRAAGRRLRGRRQRRCRRAEPGGPGAVPRRAARLLGDARQRVRAAPRPQLLAEREDGRARERRHLPQPRDAERLDAARRQPAVPAAGRRRQRPRRQPRRRGGNAAADLPFGINGQDTVFKHPTSYMWSTGVQREIAVRLRRRRHLRRPSRPVPAARAQHQPAAGRARSRPTRASTSPRSGRTRATT